MNMDRQSELLLSFYGLVSLRTHAPSTTIKFLRTEWGRFEVEDEGNDPDIIAFLLDKPTSTRLFAGGDTCRQVEGWYKGCFWRATIAENDGRMTVWYSIVPRSNFLFKDSCLEPLVLARLQLSGFHSLHASSLCIGRRAWAFCGPPGSGKTILALMGARNGLTLLSDDVTIIGNGRIHPYLVPPRIYLHHSRNRELFKDLILPWVSTDFVWNFIVSIATFGQVKIPTRMTIPGESTASPSNQRSYPVGGLFFLKKAEGASSIRTYREKESVLHDVVQNLALHGTPLVTQFAMDNDTRGIRSEALKSNVETLVDDGRCFKVELRPWMSFQDWKDVYHEVVRIAEELS